MAKKHQKKENQHYIPQFYLRYFSSNDDRTTINVFRFKDKNCNQNNIAKQCKGSRIYGSDQDEEDITKLDDKHGILLHKIISNGIETISSHDYSEFIVFTGLTYARSKRIALMFENGIDPFHFEELPQKLDKPYRGGVLVGVSIPAYWLNFRLLFLINNTDIDFITSDSPVVLYNKYFHSNRASNNFKYDADGLQVFYPLSNRICAIFYDERFYKPYCVNGIKTHRIEHIETHIIEIKNRFHINQINNLQYFNSIDVLLFSNINMMQYITRCIDELTAKNFKKDELKTLLQKDQSRIISSLTSNYIPFKMNSPYLKIQNK
ncbi:MAG: DUF4238 domain-containing protein [Planctomycetes bacterium]|nr:DUF4238 domain-containing protein [Planctomycetota bacterium]